MEQWQIMILTLLVQIVFGVVIAIMGFLIKRSISQIDVRLEKVDERFKGICGEIEILKERRSIDREYFVKEFVTKDDFIREVRSLDQKIEGVAIDVKKLLILSGRREANVNLQ